ncbi:retinoic acid early transcript 1E-like [Dasypus novemcinctus]|uniref:retinoic acid early transcript 1E-like n=1 Tax=Dasypus novemcinctus TaxID=9361 RepID=UPI00265E9F3E|nr:retinoic acid early transcript 1E-like [Dasypus novemcinctus]
MGRARRSGVARLVLALFLPMLGVGGAPAPARDTHSLSCNLIMTYKSRPGEPWCEVEGRVDQKTFFYYGCGSHRAKPLGSLGEKVNSTKVWTELSQTLEDVGQELRMNLLDIKLEENIKGPPTLEAQMTCRHEADQCQEASWKFSINGQVFLFDSIHTNWSAIHPGARGIKEKWESNSALVEHLRKVSKGDCSHWLREFSEHWGKMLEPEVVPTLALVSSHPPASPLPPWLLVLIAVLVTVLSSLSSSPSRWSFGSPDRWQSRGRRSVAQALRQPCWTARRPSTQSSSSTAARGLAAPGPSWRMGLLRTLPSWARPRETASVTPAEGRVPGGQAPLHFSCEWAPTWGQKCSVMRDPVLRDGKFTRDFPARGAQGAPAFHLPVTVNDARPLLTCKTPISGCKSTQMVLLFVCSLFARPSPGATGNCTRDLPRGRRAPSGLRHRCPP